MTQPKQKQKMEMGICGKCGSDDVNYGVMIPEGEGLYYEMDCGQCGAWMHEWYSMTYDGTDVMVEEEEDDGQFASVEYLQEGDTILDERSKDD